MENILNLTKSSIENIPNNAHLVEHKNKQAINKLLNVRENFSEEVMRKRAIELAKVAFKAGVKSAFIGTTGPAGFLAILSEELIKRNIKPITDILIYKAEEKIKKEVKEEVADAINNIQTKIANRKQSVSSKTINPVLIQPTEDTSVAETEIIILTNEQETVFNKEDETVTDISTKSVTVDPSANQTSLPLSPVSSVDEVVKTDTPVTKPVYVPETKPSLISRIKKFLFRR